MLTLTQLVFRNLAYHSRNNFAVLLGVVVGSAVLTGALLVGDSLRGSLRERVERQLCGIDSVAFLPRPIRITVADHLTGQVSPVLLLPGSLQAPGDPATAPYLGRVTILGIDERFKPAGVSGIDWNSSEKHIVLSHRVAEKLGVKPGDKVKLGTERFSEMPRSSSLARRGSEDVTATELLEVVAVLPTDAPENDFNLTPNPAAPLNVFVPIRTLTRLATGSTEPKATAILARGSSSSDLNGALRDQLTLADYGLKIREVPYVRRLGSGGYLSVESTELILSPSSVQAIMAGANDRQLRSQPTIVYVADTLASGKKEIPYPIICGLDPTAQFPLGPMLPPGVMELRDNEVILLDWSGSELNGLPAGTKLRLTYFDPEVEGEGRLKETELALAGYIALAGAARDRNLTPEIRGVTDARANLFDWDRPPVLPKARIRERVPDKHPRSRFFNENKATPMAYVNLETGRKLFGSRYGVDTSVRISPGPNETMDQTVGHLTPAILSHLDAKSAGFNFDPIRERLLTASRGGTDFGGLFLGFSCFLIIAALMLVGLLFRLSLERRAKEVGLLLATGFSVRQIRQMLLREGMLVAVIGAAIGLVVGLAYNQLLLSVLLGLWPDENIRSYFKPHASALSFGIGFIATVLMAFVALWWGMRGLAKVTPPALLRGETQVAEGSFAGSPRWLKILAFVLLIFGIGLIGAGASIDNPEYRAMTFFFGGGLLLTAAILGLRIWLRRQRHTVVNGRGVRALTQLGMRNAARNSGRSLSTVLLLALATFLLVAVESFRQQPSAEFLTNTGGSGGFNLIGECDVPLFQSFENGLGRADLENQLKRAYAPKGSDPDAPPITSSFVKAKEQLGAMEEVLPLRLRGGDDASCANLFQAAHPRILGVPHSLIAGEKRFRFAETLAQTPEEKSNPWWLLENTDPNAPLPVFCEQNTAEWMLKKAVGDTFTMPDDKGDILTLRIVGTLVDSPFQSELIMSDAVFLRTFPKQGGYRIFLIRTTPGTEQDVARTLEIGFRADGFTATPTRERVESYQAVVGAYLSTFQLLGGFGLLLGVLGLAVVILRGVWERLGELALLRAIGYRTRTLHFLVLVENVLLLILGLVIGVLTALASVAPHVASGAAVPWVKLAVLLGVVLVVGFVVAFVATASILRVPLIPALRKE